MNSVKVGKTSLGPSICMFSMFFYFAIVLFNLKSSLPVRTACHTDDTSNLYLKLNAYKLQIFISRGTVLQSF